MQAQPSPESKINFEFSYVKQNTRVTLDGETSDRILHLSGRAYLSPNDRFEKAKGRVVAITKAIRHLPREIRRQIWADYWAQGHRRPR